MNQEIINTLYEVFQKYPLKDKIECCPHCELDEFEKSLHNRSLRQLTWSDIGLYPFKAMTTMGDANDFKHFLPRIMELYVIDYMDTSHGIDVFIEKLIYAKWDSWPIKEIESIRNFMKAWYKTLKDNFSEESNLIAFEEIHSALSNKDIDMGIA